MLHQLVGVEMVVMAEDLFDDQASLAGHPLATAFEELRETLQRRKVDLNRSEREGLRHDSRYRGWQRVDRATTPRRVPGPSWT